MKNNIETTNWDTSRVTNMEYQGKIPKEFSEKIKKETEDRLNGTLVAKGICDLCGENCKGTCTQG